MMRKHAQLVEGIAMTIMALGVLMVWQPWFHVLYRWGFGVTIVGIISFMAAAHLPRDAQEAR